jgi:hypothetical protein
MLGEGSRLFEAILVIYDMVRSYLNMGKYIVVVQQTIHEEHQIELEANTAMSAFDEARKMTQARNKNSTSGQYAVIKVERK